MVKKEGYDALTERQSKDFEIELDELGWKLELMPGSEIPDFGDLIESVR